MPEESVILAETQTVTEVDLAPLMAEEFTAKLIFWRNLATEILSITIDKVRLRTRDFIDQREARNSWQTPAGILVSLVASLVASDFKDLLFPAATWLALFSLSALACLVWLIASFRNLLRYRNVDAESFVESLKYEGTVSRSVYPVSKKQESGASDSDSRKSS